MTIQCRGTTSNEFPHKVRRSFRLAYPPGLNIDINQRNVSRRQKGCSAFVIRDETANNNRRFEKLPNGTLNYSRGSLQWSWRRNRRLRWSDRAKAGEKSGAGDGEGVLGKTKAGEGVEESAGRIAKVATRFG